MSANPFLMDDADYGAPAAAPTESSNPFLSNADFEVPAMAENPFLSAMGGVADQGQYMAAGTNPFAAFGAPEPVEDAAKPANFFGNEARASIPELGTPYPQAYEGQVAPQVDMYQAAEPEQSVRQHPSTLDLNKGDQDYCMETSEIFGGQGSEPTSGFSSPNKGGPRRPPPPRPVPPSQETVNLILSVTGEMEATSSHLLDRLPPTRTPSPTLIRDLQTPSPTPETGFSDFLDVGGGAAPDTTVGAPIPQHQEVNLLGDLDDMPPAPMSAAEMDAPRRPPPPGRPPGGPPAPKNVNEIMGLYESPVAAPPPPEPVDLLGSDDSAPAPTIFDMGQSAAPMEQAAFAPVPAPVTAPVPAPVPVPEPEPEPVVEAAATVVPPVRKLSSPSVPAPPPPSVVPAVTPPSAAPPSVPSGPPPKPPPPARPPPVSAPLPAPPPPEPAPVQPPLPSPPVEEPPPAEPADAFDVSPAAPAPELPPAPAPIVPREQSPPKGRDEIMNLFGADQAAATAFSSAPVQMTDDFFGSGGGFDMDQQPAAPAAPVAPAAVAPAAPVAASPTAAFGAPPKPPPPVPPPPAVAAAAAAAPAAPANDSDFDVFAAKFESAGATTLTSDPFDPFAGSGGGDVFGGGGDAFGGGGGGAGGAFGGGGGGDAFGGGGGDAFGGGGDAWGSSAGASDGTAGFGGEETFDEFLSMQQPPKAMTRTASADSDEQDFSVVIRPKRGSTGGADSGGFVPALAPPPKTFDVDADAARRFNPFDEGRELSAAAAAEAVRPATPPEPTFQRTDSQETPPTPLFDEDTSQPLEDFPRIKYAGPGWDMQLRQPNRKKITGQRFWKKIFIRLVYQGENPVLQLLNTANDKDPFQELPLQPCYCVSEISAQQFDQYGKIFTIKLQYVFYKERPGVRPGQVTKAERITNKLSQFAAYAIQGDYQGCKEFASDLKKLGMPVEHAPQISQLFKIGSQNYEDMKAFSVTVEEALFRLSAHRDRALTYKQEEVQITAVDEVYVEQDKTGHVCKQVARVRLFFLGFLSGMPDVELGVNDMWRQGKEVVGRHDIIPVVTEEWIRLEAVEFHSCIQQDEYENTRTIKFKPPDACYIELMRFRVRPPRNRELPLQLKVVINVTGNKVDLRADILVPGFSSRKYGQIPCEDVCVRIPIPECWIYLFRVEKHFRYGSVKSAHRRTGKIKGIERFLGAVDTMEPSLMEVTSGQAKYEHQHRSIVWRMPRLPKEGQGAYTTHNLVCHMNLTSFDQIPPELTKYAYVEFTMPQTQVSHTTVRSVSITNSPSDDPPEKYVRQLARHEYRVEVDHTKGEGPGAYIAATISKPVAPEPIKEERPAGAALSDSDSSD